VLSLDRLRALHAVAAAGSIRGGAEALHVTTSAMSQQMAKLEREVGEPLVERQGRGIRLTDAGKVLAEHAGRLLDEVERIEADLAGRRGAVVGQLAVAAFATAARGLLPTALRTLRADYPELSVRLSELEPGDAIERLRRTDVDVAVVQDWADTPLALPEGVCGRHLLVDHLDLAVPADHPLAHRRSVSLTDVTGEDWVTWTSGQLCHDWLRATLAGQATPAAIAHTASEHSTQLALVAAGLGVAIIPRLGREHAADTVRFISLRPGLTRQVHVLWRSGATHRPAVTAVVQSLVSAVAHTGVTPPVRHPYTP
jgi:DNA-binding transcriptional LysR family regulator